MRQRDGFTLIELLIVTVVLGIIAMIAVAQLGDYRRRAYEAAMRSDLRSLAVSQEVYHFDNHTYAPLAALDEFEISPGVQIQLTHADAWGWAATATHSSSPGAVCGIFVGTAPAGSAEPATEPSVVVCR